MVKIRLMRVGKRKQPSYRVVVADSRSPRDGRIIEAIGHYQPRQDPSVVEIDNERALYWLQNGAQASNTVRQLLRITGAWSEFSGEAPLAGPPPAKVKATPAASVTQAEEDEASEDSEDTSQDDENAAQPETAVEATEEIPEAVATSAEEDSVANEAKADTPAEEEPTS